MSCNVFSENTQTGSCFKLSPAKQNVWSKCLEACWFGAQIEFSGLTCSALIVLQQRQRLLAISALRIAFFSVLTGTVLCPCVLPAHLWFQQREMAPCMGSVSAFEAFISHQQTRSVNKKETSSQNKIQASILTSSMVLDQKEHQNTAQALDMRQGSRQAAQPRPPVSLSF